MIRFGACYLAVGFLYALLEAWWRWRAPDPFRVVVTVALWPLALYLEIRERFWWKKWEQTTGGRR